MRRRRPPCTPSVSSTEQRSGRTTSLEAERSGGSDAIGASDGSAAGSGPSSSQWPASCRPDSAVAVRRRNRLLHPPVLPVAGDGCPFVQSPAARLPFFGVGSWPGAASGSAGVASGSDRSAPPRGRACRRRRAPPAEPDPLVAAFQRVQGDGADWTAAVRPQMRPQARLRPPGNRQRRSPLVTSSPPTRPPAAPSQASARARPLASGRGSAPSSTMSRWR